MTKAVSGSKISFYKTKIAIIIHTPQCTNTSINLYMTKGSQSTNLYLEQTFRKKHMYFSQNQTTSSHLHLPIMLFSTNILIKSCVLIHGKANHWTDIHIPGQKIKKHSFNKFAKNAIRKLFIASSKIQLILAHQLQLIACYFRSTEITKEI